jgi:cytochrome c oxidase cbb3-type subunit 3
LTDDSPPEMPLGIDPIASRRIFLGMLALVAGAALTYSLLRPAASPPPAAIAGDALLVEGRTIYLIRCVNCHGESGRGDGAIAKNLMGPPVGNLADASWKHGDRPEQILAVIAQGAPGTAMSGWRGVIEDRGLRAVAAYVYYLAGRKVPEVLRGPSRSEVQQNDE